jgi:hypothetical protein
MRCPRWRHFLKHTLIFPGDCNAVILTRCGCGKQLLPASCSGGGLVLQRRLVDEARTLHAGEPVRRLKAIKSGCRAAVQKLALVFTRNLPGKSACAAALNCEDNDAAAACAPVRRSDRSVY